VSQVAENNGHDFLLRLGQRLKDGGIARWAQQLVPWLFDSQQRVPLRGLMFSLPAIKPLIHLRKQPASADAEKCPGITTPCADPAGVLAGYR
jgi:type VI secretion system protein ImpL